MTSTIAIIQSDADFGEQLSRTLRQDGHNVLPIACTLTSAYKNFTMYEADICVIDGSLPEADLIRLSDMFTLMDVPHIINYNDKFLLSRSPVQDSRSTSRSTSRSSLQTTRVQPPMTQAISLAVWELHVSLQLSRPMTAMSPALSYV